MAEGAGDTGHDPDSTDAEHEAVVPTEPQWRQFECDVVDMISKLDPKTTVSHDYKIKGRFSGLMRQVDILVVGTVIDSDMTIAVECKRYARRIGIGGVDEFAGKLLDLGVEKGVLYAFSGFTEGARSRASGALQPRIELRDLSVTSPPPSPWQPGLPEFTGFGDCPNNNCYLGDIHWQEWINEEGPTLEAGPCGSCGTWAVRCPQCDTITGFFWDETDCDGCEQRYALIWGDKEIDVENVVILSENEE